MRILVAGATGYIGRQLAPQLLDAGHDVTCMVRDATRALPTCLSLVRAVEADALRPETLSGALEKIEVAYYLIHSMSGAEKGFEERDRQAAYNFATAASWMGVQRIIYLGGLAAAGSPISDHLKSRQETGAVLRKYGPPLIEFRAGIIVGNGSTSFEIIRCLTERVPIMICPRWVMTRTQPISVDDVLAYLVAALDLPDMIDVPIEIGGATVETYRSMMLTYARARGLKRWLIRVPVLTPRLSSYWLDLVTPISAAITRPLIEGLRTESVCANTKAAELFPTIRPLSYEGALASALERPAPMLPLPHCERKEHCTIRSEGVICDLHQMVINAPMSHVFGLLQTAGGRNGWFYADALWRLRGWVDQLMGGVGMSRGRSREFGFRAGDVIDFWKVEQVEDSQILLLRAEMKLPGDAWLQFTLESWPESRTLLRCCAWFQPRGLGGETYWYALYPIHVAIFRGMVRRIREQSERNWLVSRLKDRAVSEAHGLNDPTATNAALPG
jgi:uncharacterized protein YbjT (DUF2867 family)